MKNYIFHLLFLFPVFGFSQTIDFSSDLANPGEIESHREAVNAIYEEVSDFEILEVDYSSLRNQVKNNSDFMDLNLRLNQKKFSIEMIANDLKSHPDFKTVVPHESGTEMILEKGEVSRYKGFLADKSNSNIRFSIRDDIFYGLIDDGEDEYFIEPARRYDESLPFNWVIFYKIENVISKDEHVCGTDHSYKPDNGEKDEQGAVDEIGYYTHAKNSEPCVTADIALAADGSMVDKFGSVQAVENEILDIFNVVEQRYEDPDINIEYDILTIFISPSVNQDPWNYNQDFGDYLQSFTQWGNNNGFGTTNYSLASLWTDKEFNGGAVGLAWLAQVCQNLRYNTNIHFSPNATQLIQVQTHEMGHNWSAEHAPDDNSPNNVYIMAPSVGNLNDQWHPNTILSISDHKSTRQCITPSCENPPIANFTSNSSGITCTGIIDFTDQSQNSPDTWLWDFGDGNTSTDQNPSHAYSQSGTYSVSLTTTNQYGNDVATQNNFIQVELLESPEVEGDERCGPGDVNLSAAGGDNLIWYDSPTGNNEVNTGGSFSQTLSQTTTYWVANETVVQEEFVGPEDNSIGTGAYFDNNDNWGLEFNALNDFVLKSVKVFSNQASTRTIEVLDNNENVIFTASPFIPNGESRVELNFEIPQGNGYLIKLTGNNLNLYRTGGGANYPYSEPGLVSITGNNTAPGQADDFYYYFFDWEVHEPKCSSARIPVLANLNACLNTDIIEKENGITVYPNPSSGMFTIDLVDNLSIQDAYVVNSLGQQVNTININLSTDKSEVDLSDVSQGVYTLYLVDESQVVYQKKLIKK